MLRFLKVEYKIMTGVYLFGNVLFVLVEAG
jgi:hypothetical protein